MNKDYVVYVAGGLANKMFHLAFGLSLKEKGYNVLFDDFSASIEFEHDDLSLNRVFPKLELNRMPKGMYHFGGDNSFKGKILRRLPFFTGERYSITHGFDYDSSFLNSIKKETYMIGSFQNLDYLPKNSKILKRNFTFSDFKDSQNLSLVHELKKCESVAIHIRKGDGYATWAQFIGTCPVDYYQKAIGLCVEKLSNPKFYVFTDVPSVVKDYLKGIDYTLVDWNPTVGYGNHFDMQLMSCAKHNIIANSTYSWWGAWLNDNPDKMVIAPKEWFKLTSQIQQQPNLYPSDWIQI